MLGHRQQEFQSQTLDWLLLQSETQAINNDGRLYFLSRSRNRDQNITDIRTLASWEKVVWSLSGIEVPPIHQPDQSPAGFIAQNLPKKLTLELPKMRKPPNLIHVHFDFFSLIHVPSINMVEVIRLLLQPPRGAIETLASLLSRCHVVHLYIQSNVWPLVP